MCAVKRCDYIDLDDCFRMRSAYFYGFVTAETEANKVLNRIHEGIEALFPKEGEKDG